MRATHFFLICILYYGISFSQHPESSGRPSEKNISATFYITANISEDGANGNKVLEKIIFDSRNDEKGTLLIIGNSVRPKGYPKKKRGRKRLKDSIKKEIIRPTDLFNGDVILMPGKNEWNRSAPQSIDDLESFLQDNGKAKFWPNDGCAIEGESISDEVELVMVDSQWFFEDWADHPYINEKCELKTREQFFAEFKDELKDNQGKTIVVAVHQPVMSNTQISMIDKMGGFTPESYQNAQNRMLRGRLETIARQFQDVIFVSGKDRNLQYLEDDGIPQIISGAVGKTQSVRATKEEHFGSEENGYAKLTIFTDGSSVVDFFSVSQNTSEPLFTKKIKRERPSMEDIDFRPVDPANKTEKASIYTREETEKSGFYKWLWGEHYRNLYSKPIAAPVLFIDSHDNYVRPISEGGGTQSRSLRLIDDNEHEYTLRALRKSAVRFLQATAVKDHFVEDYLKNTVAERILLDFYTTSHPYAQFSMNEMYESLDIPHANPNIWYVPKQKGLEIYNEDYGDELYMLEEHVGDENKSFKTFGSPDDILSTKDLLLELRESKKSFVDEPAYIRARLVDMLTGNWDRHQDQWRWAEFEAGNGKKRYEPIPRDWDQVFPKYDGPIIGLLKYAFPLLRKMESYGPDIKNIKWFNLSGYPLDKAFLKTASWEDWKAEVNFIQQNLTDKAIDEAFASLPEAAQDESIETIKKDLRSRRTNLEAIARSYHNYLNNFEVLLGTEEDDNFQIVRKPNGITDITIKQGATTVFEHSYNGEETKDIWVYGLDGEDVFGLSGNGNRPIRLKILGGKENDTYDFQNTQKAKLYDYKSKSNTVLNPKSKKWLTDSYEVNTYNYKKRKYHENVVLPSAGYDGDTGFRLGLIDKFTTYGLVNNPFKSQHTLGAEYYFATKGFAIDYSAEFAHVFYRWNLGLDLRFSSPNFTMNYFGQGNGTEYDKDAVDRDFNRVRIRQWHFSPYLVRKHKGNSFYLRMALEAYEVSDDDSRLIGQLFSPENDVFDAQRYMSSKIAYNYMNENNPAFPHRAMEFNFAAGYRKNLDGNENNFGYLKPSLSLVYPLHPSGIAVLATKIAGETLLGKDYEFYHGAVIGGNTSLRAYRNERFNGKLAFYQSTDLRVGLTRYRTNFVPLQIGISAGFDYGRVWAENEESGKWHNNYGGSVWMSGFSALTGNLGLYYGEDGNRLIFSIGFTF